MITLTHGGQYNRAVYLPCPPEVSGDESADAYLSSILDRCGPIPPGLTVSWPIRCRSENGSPIVRVPFYGVPMTMYQGTTVLASMEAVYRCWIDRFVAISRLVFGKTADPSPR